MYLLVKTELKDNLNDKFEIVANCDEFAHRTTVLKKYCDQHNINFVENRDAINTMCKPGKHEVYTYFTDGQYIILDCVGYEAGILFSGYVQKKCIGYFQFKFYKPDELILANIKDEFPKKII